MIRSTVLILGLTALLALPVQAKPRAAKRPRPLVPQAILTVQEQACQATGHIASSIAASRNQGIPLTDTLVYWRAASRKQAPEYPWVEQLTSAMVYDLYLDAASMTPSGARRVLENLCLAQGIQTVLTLYGLMATPPPATDAWTSPTTQPWY